MPRPNRLPRTPISTPFTFNYDSANHMPSIPPFPTLFLFLIVLLVSLHSSSHIPITPILSHLKCYHIWTLWRRSTSPPSQLGLRDPFRRQQRPHPRKLVVFRADLVDRHLALLFYINSCTSRSFPKQFQCPAQFQSLIRCEVLRFRTHSRVILVHRLRTPQLSHHTQLLIEVRLHTSYLRPF